MPLPTETINCNFTLADDAEFAAGRATVVFLLTSSDWDTVENVGVPATEIRIPLDADGEAVATLWPNDRGNRGTSYRVWVEVLGVSDGRGLLKKYEFPNIQPLDGEGPYDIADLWGADIQPVPGIVISCLTQADYDAAIAARDAAATSAIEAGNAAAAVAAAQQRPPHRLVYPQPQPARPKLWRTSWRGTHPIRRPMAVLFTSLAALIKSHRPRAFLPRLAASGSFL
jgi:hypothetical protein